MNLNSVLGNDYTVFDSDSATTSGRHALTLTNPTAADGSQSTTCSNAVKRSSLQNDIVQNEFGTQATQCRWHIWKNDLADTSFVPAENGGYLTDADGNIWRINGVSLMTAGTRYEIETTLKGALALR